MLQLIKSLGSNEVGWAAQDGDKIARFAVLPALYFRRLDQPYSGLVSRLTIITIGSIMMDGDPLPSISAKIPAKILAKSPEAALLTLCGLLSIQDRNSVPLLLLL